MHLRSSACSERPKRDISEQANLKSVSTKSRLLHAKYQIKGQAWVDTQLTSFAYGMREADLSNPNPAKAALFTVRMFKCDSTRSKHHSCFHCLLLFVAMFFIINAPLFLERRKIKNKKAKHSNVLCAVALLAR